MIRGFENVIKWCKNPEEIENVRKEELDLWPIHEGHWFKFLKIEDKWRMIDLEIFGLIKALNDSGLTTSYCCAGHVEESFKGICDSYIAFKKTIQAKEYIDRLVSEYKSKGGNIITTRNSSYKLGLVYYENDYNSSYVIRFRYKQGERESELEKFEKLILDCIPPETVL